MEEKIAERDFEQEVRELYKANPGLRGEELPEDVVKDCIGGKKLLDAYDAYAEAQAEKQNKRSADRAPVKSVTGGGSVDTRPEDAFLRGFNDTW